MFDHGSCNEWKYIGPCHTSLEQVKLWMFILCLSRLKTWDFWGMATVFGFFNCLLLDMIKLGLQML